MSASREAAACYRLYAANCLELAEHISDAQRRVFLLHMARDWLKLAVQVERANSGDDDPQASRPSHEPGAGPLQDCPPITPQNDATK
jgi:hypothetical protein